MTISCTNEIILNQILQQNMCANSTADWAVSMSLHHKVWGKGKMLHSYSHFPADMLEAAI